MRLGYPIALIYTRAGRGPQSVRMLVLVLPLLTSVAVRTFSWIVILGRQDVLNEMLLGLGLIGRPLMLLYWEAP